MKHIILLTFITIFTSSLFAQSEYSFNNSRAAINVYPNPTTEYVAVNDENDRVNKLEFYNLTGRQMKSFSVVRGEKYSVYDLPDGVYFVRLIDKNNRIVTTQRVTKR